MEILVDNRDGTITQIPASSFSWVTEKVGSAGELDIVFKLDPKLKYEVKNGAVIRIKDGKHKIFYGFVFKIGESSSFSVDVKAYDQLRYLKNEDTFVLKNATASKVTKEVCSKFGLKVGTIEDTGYKIPTVIEDGKTGFDVICKALDNTLIETIQNFILFDNFGKVELRNMTKLAIPMTEFFIGDGSLLTDYKREREIDSDTINQVKFVRDNKKTKKREVFISKDSNDIKAHGLLQKYKKVDEKMTAAEIKRIGEATIKAKRGEKTTLSLEDCIGDWRVRAGVFVYVLLSERGLKGYMLVNKCSHDWSEGGLHKMTLELEVLRK